MGRGRHQCHLLDIGLDHLTLARAALYQAILGGERPSGDEPEGSHGLSAPRRSARLIPRGLLTRTLFRAATGDFDGAREDLDEAFEIAERGPMRLYLADIHLHRARLFGLIADRPKDYPWVSPRDDLDTARKLIEDLRLWPAARGARRRRGGVGAHLRDHRARWLTTGLTRAAKRLTIVRGSPERELLFYFSK